MFPGRGRCRTGTRTKPCQAAPGGAGRGAAGSVCALCAPQAAAHGFRRSPSYSPAGGTQTHGRTAAIGAARVRRGAHAPLIPAEGSRSREPGPQQPLASRHSAPGCAFPLPDPLKCFLAWRAGLSTYISNLMAHKLLAKGFHYSPSVSYKGEKKLHAPSDNETRAGFKSQPLLPGWCAGRRADRSAGPSGAARLGLPVAGAPRCSAGFLRPVPGAASRRD